MSGSDAKPFGPVRRITAGALDVGYVDIGPRGGRAVLLLHGWPYDIHSYADAAPALAAARYRVITPYLRGYGPTRFLSGDAMRNGQQAVLAVDAIALMDAPVRSKRPTASPETRRGRITSTRRPNSGRETDLRAEGAARQPRHRLIPDPIQLSSA